MMLLSEGETTMAAAHLAGYADAAALTRAFRRVTGMTPAEFRRG
jgi:AraC-like DNA-binding protein